MSQSPRPGGRWDAEPDLEPLEPDKDQRRQQLEDRLVDEDRHPDSAQLDRLLGDGDLLLRLQLSAYAPKIWNPIAEEFVRYGLAVISSWIRRGLIFGYVTKATGYGFSYIPDGRITDRDDVHDLASMTVVLALDKFLEIALKGRRWDPNKGASLKTFFIGQCKIQFPNVYREWLRSYGRRPSPTLDDLVERNVLAPAHDNVEAQTSRDAEIAEALALIESPEAKAALTYQAVGYSYAEIAEILQLPDAKAVENLVFRYKRRAQANAQRRQESA